MTSIKNFYEHKPAGGVKPEQMVMLLHGLGSDGRDLISLAPLWARDLPQAIFISPDAPFPCDMAPMGYQWFSLQDRSTTSILKGIQTVAPILKDFISAQLEKYQIPAQKFALAGFSQGCMMSLYMGPRYPEPIAGVLGYSGALVWEEQVVVKALHKIPVRLIHGEADNVVPITAYQMAHKTLTSHGFIISGHTTPGLMHSIDDEGLRSGGEFLKSILD